jgi:leucyl-tRNA synthetase
MKNFYDHAAIEAKWNKHWQELSLYSVDPAKAQDGEAYYCLDMFPYPSGDGLHVGHWRGYVLSDVYARRAKLQGKTVLHPMGFDAFGLPAENAAIKNQTHPKEYTETAISNFTGQLHQLGASFDWSKTLNTSSPEYYKWTQWLFLQLFKHGHAEKRDGQVNWCPKDETVLANEQVVDGRCERCGSTVSKKNLSQWYFKTTSLAQELLDGLDEVEWPEHVKTLQRNWIGKSTGAELSFTSPAGDIRVFTTRPDTLFGVTAIVLAPEHPLVDALVTPENKASVAAYLEEVRSKTNVDRQQQKETAKTAVFTGSSAKVPLTGTEVPIWVADYVLMEYGTGAVMSVPAHDERDNQFARTHKLPIAQVIEPQYIEEKEPGKVRPDLPFVPRDGIIALVKHHSDNKYLGLKWKKVAWGTWITGGIEAGQTAEQAAREEILQETGYKNLKLIAECGVVHGKFFHVPKNENRHLHGHILNFELENDERDNVTEEEQAIHELVWLKPNEVEQFMTADAHKWAWRVANDPHSVHAGDGYLVNSGEYSGKIASEADSDIVNAAGGKSVTTYRLRDWLVSRQRYWGAPIPIVYDPDGQPHQVKEEHLPLTLPTDIDFLPGGESPLARSHEYVERAEKLYGKGWRFETDTLDTFVDSSWYFLRYLTPKDADKPFDRDLVKKWLPVDLYIGGIEHATLHLLYARYIARFLTKYGDDSSVPYLDSSAAEPFNQLFNIGMITLHGAKMSKSKGNVVSPDPLIEHYGTDALRGYELFVGPMDVEAEWNVNGINGIHRFLIKLWAIQPQEEVNEYANNLLHKYLTNIAPMIDGFRVNTWLSEAMIYVNEISKSGISKGALRDFLITLSPIFPYICEELWSKYDGEGSIFQASWPKVESKLAGEVSIVFMYNQRPMKFESGSTRSIPTTWSDEDLKENAKKWALERGLPVKSVYASVSRKFVNILG